MNKVVGYTTGVFDLFHIGHLRLLKRAKRHCDYLIVGVSTDDFVKSYKHKTPVIPLSDRLEIVSSVKYVDEVVVQTSRDKKSQFHDICYDILFVGDDWKGDPVWKDLEAYLARFGANIQYFKYTDHVSSTKLTKLLQSIYEDDL